MTNETTEGQGCRLYWAGGCACVGLAIVGTVLPLLPTTPFLLLAAWLFSKSSPQFRDRLRRHPRFGPLLQAWQTERAIPVPAKAAALITLSGSWLVILLLAAGPLVPSLAGPVMGAAGIFVATRPVPLRTRSNREAFDTTQPEQERSAGGVQARIRCPALTATYAQPDRRVD